MIEACVSSLSEAVAAEKAGADRLELCSALELGGLTPSIGVLEEVLQAVAIPVVAMVRPRAGGFCYSADELRCMRRDAEHILSVGAKGIVFGCLDRRGELDCEAIVSLVEIARGHDVVFHRAFDFHIDMPRALLELVEMRVTRILTSGGQATALEGAEMISRLIQLAAGRIDILPGGGIRGENVGPLRKQTGCSSVHLGPSVICHDGSVDHRPDLHLVDTRILQGNGHRVLDAGAVGSVAGHRPG